MFLQAHFLGHCGVCVLYRLWLLSSSSYVVAGPFPGSLCYVCVCLCVQTVTYLMLVLCFCWPISWVIVVRLLHRLWLISSWWCVFAGPFPGSAGDGGGHFRTACFGRHGLQCFCGGEGPPLQSLWYLWRGNGAEFWFRAAYLVSLYWFGGNENENKAKKLMPEADLLCYIHTNPLWWSPSEPIPVAGHLCCIHANTLWLCSSDQNQHMQPFCFHSDALWGCSLEVIWRKFGRKADVV